MGLLRDAGKTADDAVDDGGHLLAESFGLGWLWKPFYFVFKWTIGLVLKLIWKLITLPFRLIFKKKNQEQAADAADE